MWILFFISRPAEAFDASRQGLVLWATQILPALLPYSILSGLILSSGLFSGKRKSSEVFIICCGFLFGFPMGSRLSADFYEKRLISEKRAQLLCAFTNNMSPAFVSSFVLENQLKLSDRITETFLLLYGVPFLWGLGNLWFLHRKYPYTITEYGPDQRFLPPQASKRKKPAKNFDLNMQIIDAGIIKSFETMIRLCGYIVIFSIMAGMIRYVQLPGRWTGIVSTGFLECTNGIIAVTQSDLPQKAKYLLSLAMMSFGGLSGIAQTGSMIKDCGLSLSKYIKNRILITGLTMLAAFWLYCG